jgi:hypothetical protein
MVSISDELKERNILELISIVRFAWATPDVGHPILRAELSVWIPCESATYSNRQVSYDADE